MSRSYQYSFYNKNIGQKTQIPVQSSTTINNTSSTSQSIQQLNKTILSLKQQLKQKQNQLNELSSRLQQQQKLLQHKQFIIKEKQLQLKYIHKQNQQLHDKIYLLNQKLNTQRADIKQTIKQQVGILKQEFNFMIKETQIKNQIILQQKQKQFQRKQHDLKNLIKELSEKANSNNGSFYYQQSHSNIIKSKKLPNSYFTKKHDDFFQNQQEKPSTANSNLRNSRQSYKSTQLDHKILSSLRQSRADQSNTKNLIDRQKNTSSVSNLISLKQGGSQSASQITGRFGAVKTPIMSKLSIRRTGQTRQGLTRTPSKPDIDQIISRSKRQLQQRNTKNIPIQIPRPSQSSTYQGSSILSTNRGTVRRSQNLDNSKGSIRYGYDGIEQKRKIQKLKQISSLKMKVNMLKTQLQQQITFCQHKE